MPHLQHFQVQHGTSGYFVSYLVNLVWCLRNIMAEFASVSTMILTSCFVISAPKAWKNLTHFYKEEKFSMKRTIFKLQIIYQTCNSYQCSCSCERLKFLICLYFSAVKHWTLLSNSGYLYLFQIVLFERHDTTAKKKIYRK